MSVNDQKKEKAESECLQRAINLGIEQKDKTGEILRYLNGEPINRTKEDSPDLVRLCIKGKKNPSPVIVGIEHFQVHKMSKKKGKKIVSTGLELENRLWKTYEQGHKELTEIGEPSDESADKLMQNITKYSEELFTRDYHSFISAFHFHLSHHLSQAKRYRENLASLAGDRKIEIALLVEIKTYFPDLLLCDGIHSPQKKSRLLPICTEIVDELSKIDKTVVDYVILYFKGDPLINYQKCPESVVAVKTGNITKHLMAQHIPVYQYIEGYFSNGSFAPKLTAQKDSEGNYTIDKSDTPSENRLTSIDKCIKSGVYQLSLALRNKQPYVTTIEVQSYWDAYKPFLREFIPLEDDCIIKFKDNVTITKVLQLYDNACSKYKAL